MSDSPDNAAPGSDPLAGLYRMSKTAGLGSSDYQAVNVPSVVALVMGLASFIASFEPTLLVIPLVALVLGVLALVQIKRSGGTQTGLPWAVAGIVLSLGFGAWAATGSYREAARTAADRDELVSIVSRFSDAVRGGQDDAAYQLFSEDFRSRITLAKFAEPWRTYRERAPLKEVRSNGLFDFQTATDSNLRLASGQLIMQFENGQLMADRPQIVFTNRMGKWEIENMPAFYAIRGVPDGLSVPTR